MIQLRTNLIVADNTGAKEISVFDIGKKNRKRKAAIGHVVQGSVKVATPHAQIKKGDKVYAVVVRARKEMRRRDGSYIRFDENACVLINKANKEPIGSRVFGPVPRELRDLGFTKITSLAPEVI